MWSKDSTNGHIYFKCLIEFKLHLLKSLNFFNMILLCERRFRDMGGGVGFPGMYVFVSK